MYSIYAPNTADDMVYPGLYRLNGITVGSMPDFYGYAIVMSSLDHTIIKQLIYHNDSNQSLLRYRFNNQWTDAGEYALKDDLGEVTYSGTYTGDLNDFVKGTCYCTASTTNTPVSANGFCEAINYGNSTGFQRYTAQSKNVYVRFKAANVWSEWEQK